MKKLVMLVNVKDSHRYHGYWKADSKKLDDVKVVVGHDNKNFLKVFKLIDYRISDTIIGRKELVLKPANKELHDAAHQFLNEENVNIKGLQGVKYVEI